MKTTRQRAPIERIKALYIEGYGSTHISTSLGVARATIDYQIKKNREDWDQQRLDRATIKEKTAIDLEQLDAREKNALSLLISEIEKRIDEIKEMQNEDALDLIEKYLTLYQKFKSPKSQTRRDKLLGATEAVRTIARLAEEDRDEQVKTWLAKNAERIVDETLGIPK